MLPVEKQTNPQAEILEMRTRIRQLLISYTNEQIITDRERFVVEQRFALNGEPHRTYQEIARQLQVTRERIRQILSLAMRKLRAQPMFLQTMNTYLQQVPYPKPGKPYWLNEEGQLSPRE